MSVTVCLWDSVSVGQCVCETVCLCDTVSMEQCLYGTVSLWNSVSMEQCVCLCHRRGGFLLQTFTKKPFGVMWWIIPICVALSTFGGVNGILFTTAR